jgi:ferredoxin
MDATLQAQTAFHLTGRKPVPPLEAIGELGLRPALLARYRDLTRLRYDFPLVLVDGPAPGGASARSLTDLVSELARNTAPAGPTGEAMRKQLLHIERDIRRAAAAGNPGRLSEMWATAVARLTAGGDPTVRDSLLHAGQSIGVDGDVLDCDEAMPRRLLKHAWQVVQGEKLGRVRKDIDSLSMKLSDILRADFVHSEAGRKPESLRAGVGTKQRQMFDFDRMSRLLALGSPASHLPETRRKRIEWALSVLQGQRFFPGPGGEPYVFAFDTCRAAKQAFTERLPRMVELVKAMSIAELEVDGRYDPPHHDGFFDAYDEHSLTPQDLETFPDYFVTLGNRPAVAADTNLMELLSSGAPVKVLVETEDILEESSVGQGQFSFGVRSVQLATTAIGLGDVFVFQSTGSNLLALQARIRHGLSARVPALFSVYTATAAHSGDIPRYLVGAAAMQSRAFPAFTYDPTAGEDLASRFSLEDNPQPDRDWPVTAFDYADESLQRVSEDLAFTFADFVAADPRHADHVARVPRGAWSAYMVPVADWLTRPASGEHEVPYLLAVDSEDTLQRLVVDDRLVKATRRCLENWHRLQELGGVHSSHAQRLLARERAAWEAQKREEIEALKAAAGGAAAVVAPAEAAPAPKAEAPAPVEAEAEPERNPDEAWIETIRCSSCNECIQINDQMFAYNDNKQAYIKDLGAGTYQQLVEAAESCQIGIIHPGKPVNPKEPGLEELMERAKPFL